MRTLLTLSAAVLVAASLTADDHATRERQVRVALALASAAPPPSATCGRCRDDVDAARADALRESRPLVLFVGGCPGAEWSSSAETAGAIPAKVAEYQGDDRPAAEKRSVVLEPKKDGKGFVIAETLPGNATPAAVAAAVKKAKPQPRPAGKAKLDWEF